MKSTEEMETKEEETEEGGKEKIGGGYKKEKRSGEQTRETKIKEKKIREEN